mmetsp:Transcript_20710/g.67136  ORF Transcript_20710/g.67136 Transcript_20710/m.67136 type:complete len:220 (+) Transcript_20710:530-1189(+)
MSLAVLVRRREVVEEDVAEMAVALRAEDLQRAAAVSASADVAAHLVALVAFVEHRPAAARGVLGGRRVKGQATSGAREVPLGGQELVVLVAVRRLGPTLPQDLVLHGIKLGLPFLLVLHDLRVRHHAPQRGLLGGLRLLDERGQLARLRHPHRVRAAADELPPDEDAGHRSRAREFAHVGLDLVTHTVPQLVQLDDLDVAGAGLLQCLLGLRTKRTGGL